MELLKQISCELLLKNYCLNIYSTVPVTVYIQQYIYVSQEQLFKLILSHRYLVHFSRRAVCYSTFHSRFVENCKKKTLDELHNNKILLVKTALPKKCIFIYISPIVVKVYVVVM